jgi:hypothetical protein
MNETRKEQIQSAILLLNADQFTQGGLPDVAELNAAMPEGTEPVTAAERTEVWESMKSEKDNPTVPDTTPATAPETTPTMPETPEGEEGTPEEGPTSCKIRVIKANGNPFDLRVNGRVVATLVTGEVYENFPDEYLPALRDTDTQFEEIV